MLPETRLELLPLLTQCHQLPESGGEGPTAACHCEGQVLSRRAEEETKGVGGTWELEATWREVHLVLTGAFVKKQKKPQLFYCHQSLVPEARGAPGVSVGRVFKQ